MTRDSGTPITRWRVMEVLSLSGVAIAMGRASSSSASPTNPSSTVGGTSTTTSGCAVTPEETAGPCPDKVGMITTPPISGATSPKRSPVSR